jgi:hypothetical protein
MDRTYEDAGYAKEVLQKRMVFAKTKGFGVNL